MGIAACPDRRGEPGFVASGWNCTWPCKALARRAPLSKTFTLWLSLIVPSSHAPVLRAAQVPGPCAFWWGMWGVKARSWGEGNRFGVALACLATTKEASRSYHLQP